MTDDAGRFELPAGGAKALAVSYSGFDAWPTAIPAEGQVLFRLPKPGRVDVEFNIDGAPKEGTLFYFAEKRTSVIQHTFPGGNGAKDDLSIRFLHPISDL